MVTLQRTDAPVIGSAGSRAKPAACRRPDGPRARSVNGGRTPVRLASPAAPRTPKRRRARATGPSCKLRFALVFSAWPSWPSSRWIFGIMMAVAQDLPALENLAQYADAQNSVVYDINGNKIATLTNNQGRILSTRAQIIAP